MFDGLKQKYGNKIPSAEITPDFSGKSSIPNITPATPAPIPVRPVEIKDISTPVGQPTTKPRFDNLLSSIQPKIKNSTIAPATTDMIGEAPKPKFMERLTNPNIPIIQQNDITGGLKQLEDYVIKEQESRPEGMTQLGNFVYDMPSNVVLGGIKILQGLLQGLDQSITQMAEGGSKVLGGNPTIKDVGDLVLGSAFTASRIAFPGATVGFNVAGQLPGTKQLLEGFSRLGQDKFIEISDHIPYFNQLSEEQRSTIFDVTKYVIAGMILKTGIKRLSPKSKALVSTEPVETIKAEQASETLGRKPGEDINQAYKRKAMETHPDRPGGSKEAFQKVNEAYMYLKDQGFKEAWKNMSRTQKDTLGTIIKKVADYMKKPKKGFINIDMMRKITPQGDVPVEKPKTITEYKELARQMLDGEIMSTQLETQLQNKIKIENASKGVHQTDADAIADSIVILSNKLDIVPEAVPQDKITYDKSIQKKIDQTKSQFKKKQIANDYAKLRDSRTALERLEGLPDTADANDILEASILRNVNKQKEHKADSQLTQIRDFLSEHKEIIDPKAEEKLSRVLNGETVKDNGIDYNKEIESIMEQNIAEENRIEQQKPTTELPRETVQGLEAKEQIKGGELELTDYKKKEVVDNTKNIPKKTLYHATLEKFDKFDISKAGENTQYDNAKRGIFFSDSAKNTIDFIKVANPGDTRDINIIEANVDIKNPLDLTLRGILNNKKQARLILKLLGYTDKITSDKQALEILDDSLDLGNIEEFFESIYSDIENKKIIQEAGYDGIVAQMGKGDEGEILYEYVAFDTDQIKIQQPKKEPVTKNQQVPQQTIDWLVDKFKTMVSEEVKNRVSTRMKDKTLKTILTKFAQSFTYKPKMKDIAQAYKDPKILYEGLKMAMEKSVLDKAELEVMNDIIDKIAKQYNANIRVVNYKGHLDQSQKAVFLKWEDFKTPIKGVEDIKIKLDPINNFLKNNEGYKIHVIEYPKLKGQKKPFAMMGTKENSYPIVMKPHVLRAIAEGKKVYIEPYGGVGTSLYHLPYYFQRGLEEAHLNLFDIEKFTIIKAIKEQKMNVKQDVTNAYDTVVKEMTDGLMMNDEFKRIYTESEMRNISELKVGSKEFREALLLLGFHPNLAKEFFRQRMDSKVAIAGQLTETFKQWIGETMVLPEIKAEHPDLEGLELEDAVNQGVENILNKPGLFEKQYATMADTVKKVLDIYDSDTYVNEIQGDHNKALLTAISRHFRQRGTSGQRVISPSDGFSSIEGIKNKMIETLSKYDITFKMYGDKINIYNEDGQKFINDRAHENRSNNNIDNTIWYFDPPYVKSNKMYIKNNPDLRYALGKYSDYEGIKDIFRPAFSENNTLLFTNDVDGGYFQSIKDLMGDRMDKNIYAYKEGLTPTSFITTTDVGRGMRENQFMYYMLNKNAKILNAVQFIDKLGGDIAKGMKKNVAKLLSYVSPEMQKNLDKLERIRTGMERAEIKLEALTESINLVTTGREKQALIRQAKQDAKKGYLTGKPLLKFIDIISKNMVNLNTEQRALRKRIDNFKKSESLDAQTKKYFFDAFYKEYTDKRLTQAEQSQSEIKSIYSLNIDEVDALNKQISDIVNIARSKRIKTIEDRDKEIEYAIDLAKKLHENGSASKMESWEGEDITVGKVGKAVLNFVDQYNTFADRFFERVGIPNVKRRIDNAMRRKDESNSEWRKTIREAYKSRKLKHEDDIKINIYGLMRRGDTMGQKKVYAMLTQVGDPLKIKYTPDMDIFKKAKTFTVDILEKMINKIPMVSIRHPLTHEKALEKMEEYMSDTFLNDKQKYVYKKMREELDNAYGKASITMLEESNKLVRYIKDFRPISADQGLNKKNFAVDQFKNEDYDMTEMQYSLMKTQVEQTLDKQTTARELVPIISAYKNIAKYLTDVNYYYEVQPVINKAKKVIEGLGVDVLGDRAFDYLTNKKTGYIPDLARQGRSILDPFGKRIENLQTGFAKAVLLANPSPLLVQITNIFDTSMSGFKRNRSGKTIQNYIKTNGKSAIQTLNRSQYLQNRMGHDKIKVMQDGIKDIFVGGMQKVENFESFLLNAWDMVVGITINDSIYREGIKQGLSHKEAQYQADIATKKAIGSFEHYDLPQSNRVFKGALSPLRQFQTFVQNRYNNVRYKNAGEKIKERKTVEKIAFLVLAIASEELIRKFISNKVWGSSRKLTAGSLIHGGLTSFIPTLSTVVKTDMYGNVQIDPVNIQALVSLGKAVTEVKNSKDRTSFKFLGNIIADLAPLLQIPGGVTFGRMISKIGKQGGGRKAGF